jgi:hypothetical protein
MKTNLVYKVLSVKFRINSVKQVNLPVNGEKRLNGARAQRAKGIMAQGIDKY